MVGEDVNIYTTHWTEQSFAIWEWIQFYLNVAGDAWKLYE